MSLVRKSLWLGLAQMVEVGLQVILPMVLVRHLSIDAFGNYRLVWLIAAGAASIAPMGMLNTLAYFLPRSNENERCGHVALTTYYMLGMGLVIGLIVAVGASYWGPTPSFRELGWLAGGFTAIWLAGGLLDALPVADERGDWQAKAVIAVAVLRTVLASLAAFYLERVDAVFYALGLAATLRLALTLAYARRHHRLGSAWPGAALWVLQVRKSWPIGISALMISIRRQADQWIAAVMFSTLQFAIFSLGAVFGSLVLLMRRAVSSTLLPSMSKMEAKGNWTAVIDINNRANLAVAFFAVPLLAYIWCFGEPIYTLVYTERYVGAANVMRVLTLVWLLQIVELNSLNMLAGQMNYAARISAPLLVLSIIISVICAYVWGYVGAAAGGAAVALLERSLLIRQLSSVLQLPVRKLQAWGPLLSMLGVCWSLAALGRLAYEYRPATMPSLVAMLLVGATMTLPYFFIARALGWLPHKLLAQHAPNQT